MCALPNQTKNNSASAGEQKIDDNELLLRYLKQIGSEESYPRLAKQGITSIASLRDMCAAMETRDELANALEAEGATLGDKRLAKIFRGTDEKKIDKALDSVDRTVKKERVRPRANKELTKYLGEKGFGSELMPIFESRGITSLAALNRVLADQGDAYKDLEQALSEDTELEGTIYQGSPELAKELEALSLPEVESMQNAIEPDFSKTGLDETARNRYSQLKQAVQEVDALRQKDADAAQNLAEGISRDTKARLESILSRANSRELLSVFDKNSPVTVKDLNSTLDAVSDRLIAGTADAFNGLVYGKQEEPMRAAELAAKNCIRRGVLITATGIYECSGSDLVKGICGWGTPGPYEEVICDYESEQSYQLAEKTIKESSHTYSTSNSILGGFFSSSGIGAASGAFQYAQSTMSSTTSAQAQQNGKATKVKERSIYAPKAVITLPREGIELSLTALRYLKQIAAADAESGTEYARLFLANFGGHIFRSVTLGGRYSYVARAESTSKSTYDGLDTALSEAQKKAGSFAGGFFGSFLGGGSSAHQDETTSASATSMTMTYGTEKQTVRVSISVRGGLQEMPLDQWKQSLLLDKWWRVIDRREAIAVWDLLRAAKVAGLEEEERKRLAALLERVWVQDIFLASLAESKMAGYQKFAQILKEQPVPNSVKMLEDKLRDRTLKLATPGMTLRYLKVTTTEKLRGGEMVVTLPESYKILSGGGGALDNPSHVLIESYPEIVTAPSKKPQWKWHLKTKASVCADGRDNCSTAESAQASLTIGLIVLHDPKNEWDVRVFDRRVPTNEKNQDIKMEIDEGYVVTGGGARIDRYGISAITGNGFSKDAAAGAAEGFPLHAYYVKTSNMASGHNDDHEKVTHSLTAYCIGIQAANGAALQPVYSTTLCSKKVNDPGQCHLDGELLHVRGADGAYMIGGGAWVTGERNFLSWSLPVLEANGRGLWKAYSADRAGKYDEQKMQIVTVGLKNVQASIETGNPPKEFSEYKLTDTFTQWERNGAKLS